MILPFPKIRPELPPRFLPVFAGAFLFFLFFPALLPAGDPGPGASGYAFRPLDGSHGAHRYAEADEGGAQSALDRSPNVEDLPRERIERWRTMPPEERERIRERYRRWKKLPPEKRERILERERRWRSLPEADRHYLRQRKELLREAGPEERRVVRKFFARMRALPLGARHMARGKILEWRSLSPDERKEAMLDWPFYQGLSEEERETLRWFLFAPPGARRSGNRPPRW